MIDRDLFQLPGSGAIVKRLVGIKILQAVFIIAQAACLAGTLFMLWQGKGLHWLLLAGFIASYTLRQLLLWLEKRILDSFAEQTAVDLRARLLSKLYDQGPALVQENGTGSTVAMALDGIDEVNQYVKLTFDKTIGMMSVPVLILIAVGIFDWRSAVILLVTYPLIILFMIILGKAAKAKAEQQYGSFQHLSNNFIDSLRGIDTLKYLGLSKRYSKSIFTASEHFRKRTMAVLKVAMLSTFALDFFTTLSIAVVAVYLGFDLLNGRMALLNALAVLILAPEYYLPMRRFAGDFHATLNGRNSFHKMLTILNQPTQPRIEAPLHSWKSTDELSLDSMAFQYPKGTSIKLFSLQIKGWQKVGIIGMSGAGKTTLINLLSGFLTPKQGTIKIQDQTITTLDLPDWQNQLLYLPQSPTIFTATVRQNVAFYTPGVSDEQIRAALATVGMADWLAKLPDGLATMIGAGHREFSGGQSQRIALARALLDDKRRVMMFDEPTAHLDIETELELKERMLPLMDQRLVFFATHRLHWMKEMDWILVMDHGELVEQGTYDELLAKNGYFVSLINGMRGERHV